MNNIGILKRERYIYLKIFEIGILIKSIKFKGKLLRINIEFYSRFGFYINLNQMFFIFMGLGRNLGLIVY